MQDNNLNDVVHALKNHLNIVNIIGGYTALKKKGNKYWGCCPFHNEKTPSFSVSEDKGFFYCFGCHAGGDAINFLMRIKQQSFFEVVKDLAEQYNIELPNERRTEPSVIPQDPVVSRIIKMHELAKAFYQKKLTERSAHSEFARQYLSKRGITAQALEKFAFGLSSNNWQELLDYLKTHGFTEEQIEQAGLSSIGQSGRPYDKFRNRIIIPIWNNKGETIAFGGRITDAESQPKYLNSPETKAFVKRKTLFALHLAQPQIKKSGYTILTEGYMDTISMHVHGFENTVASLGTAFTPEQAKLISKHSRRVLFAYDNDNAGIQATIRGIDIAKAAYLTVQVLDLAPAKDPDEFLAEFGAQKLQERIEHALDPITFQIEQTIKLQAKDNSLQEKITVLGLVLKFVEHLDNSLEIDNYLNLIAQKLVVDLAIVQSEYAKLNGSIGSIFPARRARPVTGMPSKLNAIVSAQRYIIKVCLDDLSIVDYAKEQIAPDDFPDRELAEIFAAIYVLHEAGKLSEKDLLPTLSENARAQALSIILEDVSPQSTVKLVDDCIRQLKYHSLQKAYEQHSNLAIEYEKRGSDQYLDELKKAKQIKDELQKHYIEQENNY